MTKKNKTINLQEVMEIMTNDIKNGGKTIISDSLQEEMDNEEKEIYEKLKSDKNFKTEFTFACKFLYANLLQTENKINDYIEQLNLNDHEIIIMKYAMEILKTYTMNYYFYIFDNLNEEPYTEPLIKEIVNVYMKATKEADQEIISIDPDETEEIKIIDPDEKEKSEA